MSAPVVIDNALLTSKFNEYFKNSGCESKTQNFSYFVRSKRFPNIMIALTSDNRAHYFQIGTERWARIIEVFKANTEQTSPVPDDILGIFELIKNKLLNTTQICCEFSKDLANVLDKILQGIAAKTLSIGTVTESFEIPSSSPESICWAFNYTVNRT